MRPPPTAAVTGLRQGADGVVPTLADGGSLPAASVVAADGGRVRLRGVLRSGWKRHPGEGRT